MSLRSRRLAVCALAVAGTAQIARSAAIVGSMSEPFAYPDGTNFPNPAPADGSRNLGQGFNATGTTDPNAANASWLDGGLLPNGAAANKTANAPGLTSSAVGYLNGTGNKLTLDAATPQAVQSMGRRLGGQDIDAGTTYFSLLIGKNTDTIRTMNLAFFGGATPSERFAVGQIGAAAGNTNGNIALLMNNTNPAGIINSASPIAMGVGITHLIVGRIDWNPSGFETVSIWVDPANVTTEGAAGAVYASTNAFELTDILAIRPFAGNQVNAGTSNPLMPAVSANFDEIRLGGTWASVTSLAVAPEPGAIGLAGLVLVPRVLRRRREQG